MSLITRLEHLEWCKKRALEYIENGDLTNAWTSMLSDMNKHNETKNHPALELGARLFISGNLNSNNAMKEFIEGFN